MEPSLAKEGEPAQFKLITLKHPRIRPLKHRLSSNQFLSELRSVIEACSEFYFFINYHFEYKGQKIADMVPVGSLLAETECEVDIVLNTYNYHSAKHHLARVIEILNNPQFYVYLTKCHEEIQSAQQLGAYGRKNIPKSIQSLNIENLSPDLSTQFFDSWDHRTSVELVYAISMSGYNPPPTSQRLNGDLFYIHVRTLQSQDMHITASPYGFYVNQSRISNFNASRSNTFRGTEANLLDLLKIVSDKFRSNLGEFLAITKYTEAIKYKFHSKDRVRKHKWLQDSDPDHLWNSSRRFPDAQLKTDLLKLKDWNQTFQFEWKSENGQEGSYLERSSQLHNIYCEFRMAAEEGAVYLIEGKISPLNPTDDPKKHIYIHNKIFFSIANETVYDHSQEKGEDATPSSSSINTDLINIERLLKLNIPELHVLHMIVINYRGYKVIAQCIIPGILSLDQINCSQYGSIDDGKTVETNPEFEGLMIQVCSKLGLVDNVKVMDGEGKQKRIAGSPDIKGILGSDKRKYILDLLRLSPRDLNYPGASSQTCVLREQILKSFLEGKDGASLPKINVNIGTDVEFLKDEEYDKQQQLLQQIALYLKSTAIPNLINTFKNSPSQYLNDNAGVTKAFHLAGINIRYLGEVCNHELVKTETQIKLVLERVILVRSLKHLLRMAMRESNIMHLGTTIINILNSIFSRKTHVQLLEQGQLGETIHQNSPHSEAHKKKKKKKGVGNKKEIPEEMQENVEQLVNVIHVEVNKFATMKPGELWSQALKIAKMRYNYDLPAKLAELTLFDLPFSKMATLRDVCLTTGLVLEKKKYDICEGIPGNDKALPFCIKNIVSMLPIVKHIEIGPQNLSAREREAERLIEKYQVKEALSIDTALERENVCISGGLNEAGVRIYSRMGKVLYILGDYRVAIMQEERNLNLLQSIQHEDSSLVIESHLNLGLYYISLGDKEKVVYHMKTSLFLMLLAFGETSPGLLICLANLARIYQLNKQYQEAIKCYNVAISIIRKIHGKNHVKISFCFSSLASICYEMGNLLNAIEYQAQNVSVLSNIFPDNDSRLQDGIKILKMYREMQENKEIKNHMHQNKPGPSQRNRK